MKSLITLFTITSAFFLMSCSNVDQDLSPVGPEIEKISVPDESGTYPYLTSFASIPVESFTVIPGRGGIEVVVGTRGWSDDLEHIYVMLEYESETYPSLDKMVYLEKPSSSTFKLEGFETTGLKDVTVYCYEPNPDEWRVQHPYLPQQSFNYVEMQWSANEKEIEILVQDNRILGDTFAEITNDEGTYVAFIDVPQSNHFSIPNYGNPETISVKLYSRID